MKKYFTIVVLLFASAISTYGFDKFDKDSDPVLFDINTQKIKVGTGSNMERSLDFNIIEACAYPSEELVEVSLHNIGNASVRLINAYGQVVSSDYVQTNAPTVVYLDTLSSSGTFYLEIVSDSWYAEGVASF